MPSRQRPPAPRPSKAGRAAPQPRAAGAGPEPDGPDGATEDGRQPAAAAILRAATELFGERSPSSVSLRQVAERAGVNYGLIHHYFGTKEVLLAEVFRASSDKGVRVLGQAPTIEAALRSLAPHQGPGSWMHMLAWAILDGGELQPLERTATVDRVQELVELEWQAAGQDPARAAADSRVVAVATLAALNGWRFFEPFFRVVAALDEVGREMTTDDVVELILVMVRAAGAAADSPPHRRPQGKGAASSSRTAPST